MNIPYRALRNRLDNCTSECKTTQTYENSIVSKAFLAFITKMINEFEHMTEYETGLFIRSLDKWFTRKGVDNVAENSIVPKPGDICMVDWNITYTPELAYNHPCLVIDVINDLLFVVPVSSMHVDISYHPDDNPTGNIYYRKVKVDDGFAKDCVIHLGEMKVISCSRVINRINELLPTPDSTNALFDEIRASIYNILFSKEKKEYDKTIALMQEQIDEKEKWRKSLQSEKDKYRLRCTKLENRVSSLESELTKYKREHII